jgi:dTDP-4-dehydrorhamnose reductase
MRYVVLGSAGQLGRDLCPRLSGEVIALTRADVDLTQPDALRARITKLAPDIVINCAAYNYVDRAEAEPAAVFDVNAWAVRQLALISRDLHCTLVHFSSDYVFGINSERRLPYAEDDGPGPVSVYGLSKLSGEYMVRAYCARHFVVRTCGLYGVWGTGGKGGNFVETMLRLAREGKPLRVVSDQTCTPSYTVDVAATVAELVGSDRYGLYHVTNSGSCTWYEFAKAIFDLAGQEASVTPITSQQYGAAARRPAYSVLRNSAVSGIASLRPWKEALKAYLLERATPPANRGIAVRES